MALAELLRSVAKSKARRLVLTAEGLAALEADPGWPAVRRQLERQGVKVVVVPGGPADDRVG